MSAEDDHLVKNILNLNKKVTFSKPLRSEPVTEISEFNLVKSGKKRHKTIRVGDLTDSLKNRVKHTDVRQRIQTFEKKVKPLPKPLAKVKADRIRRSTAFDKVKKHLNRWNAVVTSNRGSNHLKFPLQDDIKLESGDNYTQFRLKSDLQKRLEALDEPVEVFNLEKESPYPLTMKEMLERRKEMNKMKIVESQKAAKARRENKIKSKKYHRIQRREKIKNQMKEFEQLQQSNPEEALKKLDEIERVRAEERASLRHRNTGKWAKSKQVKAKYDNTNRQELAQQLAISRELTQKINVDSDQSEFEEENVIEVQCNNDDNPWTNPIKTSEEVDTFLKSYRKFWDERNLSNNVKMSNGSENTLDKDINDEYNMENNCDVQEKIYKTKPQSLICAKKTKSKPTVNPECMATSEWDIGILSDTDDEQEDVDVLFDKYNDKFQEKLIAVKESLNKKRKLPKEKKVQTKKLKKQKIDSNDLSFKKEAKRPIIDEPLDENFGTNSNETERILSTILKPDHTSKVAPLVKNIDPNNIICTKPIELETQLPDLLTMEDDEDDNQRGAIVEAFEDDDIVESFQKEKQDEIEQDKPKDIDLSLPGWGSWGGPGISLKKKKKHKNKRFIMKFPQEFKRRDDNKGNLIINEKTNEKIKNHLVSEVPFPFKTVKDFEASIRTPIGNTFVPETAFRRMIKPAVTTKMGTIIEPMNEEILLKKKS